MMSQLVYTSLEEIDSIHSHLRASFREGKAKSIKHRKEQLLQLAYMIQDNLPQLEEALRKDLGRHPYESRVLDISGLMAETILAYKNIDNWIKPEKAPFDLNYFVFSPKVYKEPKGTVLIICPFNYPLWCAGPIAGAIAAGCTVVLKPSELTPATSQLLAELFPKYLDNDLYRVINGGVQETTKLLSLRWQHILYTGSGRVGRIVATAAAKHLTPVTLELGGKSPVIVDSNADFELTARRVLWGRSVNAGQSCVAPEYIIVQQSAQERLIEAFKKVYIEFYGDDDYTSDSYSRICTPSHWDRITKLLNETEGRIVLGGQTIREEKYIAVTVVQDVTWDDSLMKEEIFGPILPIIPVPTIAAGLEYINNHDTPLALYVFSNDSKFRAYVRENTLSGSFVENDVVIQAGCPGAPFGGVGASGYGAHKGKYSFETFSHKRTSLRSPAWIDNLIFKIRYPPYTVDKLAIFNKMMFKPIPFPRPGTPATFKWKTWIIRTVVVAVLLWKREKLFELIGRLKGRLKQAVTW